jgi:hypothetical protein
MPTLPVTSRRPGAPTRRQSDKSSLHKPNGVSEINRPPNFSAAVMGLMRFALGLFEGSTAWREYRCLNGLPGRGDAE